MYGDLGAEELARSRGPLSAELAALLRVTARLWMATLINLRRNTTLSRTKDPVMPLPAFKDPNDPSLKELTVVWIEYGRKLGFEEGRAYPAHVRRAFQQHVPRDCRRRPEWWRSSGCSWLGCLCCNPDKTPDHPMRICTSCNLAIYCSVHCQKR